MHNDRNHTHTNIHSLMATPAVPCMLAGQDRKARLKAVTKTVNVAIGRHTLSSMSVPCEYWAVTDTGYDYGYGYEAVYDPKQISLTDAEQWVRAQLAERGVNVDRFINEDEPDRAEQVDAVDLTVCAYEAGPAVTVRTGKTGHQYGLCAACADHTDRTDAVAAIMEDFRTRMRKAGQLTDTVEEFIDEVIICAPLSKGTDPLVMISNVLQTLALRHGGVCGA